MSALYNLCIDLHIYYSAKLYNPNTESKIWKSEEKNQISNSVKSKVRITRHDQASIFIS